VGELKKEKYAYYHCTGYRGKCEEPYSREEALQERFEAALSELVLPTAIVEWLREIAGTSDVTEGAAREREVAVGGVPPTDGPETGNAVPRPVSRGPYRAGDV